MRDELLSADRDPDIDDVEVEVEAGLRPRRLDEFVGQAELKGHLRVMLEAARRRGQAADHFLFAGPPGLGKTTLAHIVAAEMAAEMHVTSGPALERAGDLAAILTKLEPGDVLFIDEIHRLSTNIEEYMYSAMEDFYIDIVLDQGAGSRSIRLDIRPFTLIGATTREGMISSPLRSRFGMKVRLDYYPAEVLQVIVERSAGILKIPTEPDAAFEIARRCRGTPRIANNLLRWVRDYAQIKANNEINVDTAIAALEMLEIDYDGLDDMDNRYLEALLHKFDGGPVGIKNLAIALGEEVGTLEEVYEPFLIQEGFVQRTPQGRAATGKAAERFGVNMRRKPSDQPDLL